MAAKQIVYSENSRQAILRGVNQLADATGRRHGGIAPVGRHEVQARGLRRLDVRHHPGGGTRDEHRGRHGLAQGPGHHDGHELAAARCRDDVQEARTAVGHRDLGDLRVRHAPQPCGRKRSTERLTRERWSNLTPCRMTRRWNTYRRFGSM